MFHRGSRTRRSLVTVLFTDIVASTVRATELGDKSWRELLARHHAIVRRQLRAHGGREVDTAGDGFLSVFEAPAEAVMCACDIRDAVQAIGIEIRAGLHTGEIEGAGEKVSGIAVHTAARVLSTAKPSEVLVSSTVRDIVAGSDLVFDDRGVHELKGVPGEWHLYAADRVSRPPIELVQGAPAGSRLRKPYLLAGVAALLVVGLGAGVLLTGAPPSAPATIPSPQPATAVPSDVPITLAPNMIAAIDPATGVVTAAIRVGAGPGPIVTDGTSLWVGSLQGQTVSRIDPLAADEVDRRGRFGSPTAIATGEGYVWIADGLAGELWVVDPADPDGIAASFDEIGGDGIAVGAGAAWVTDENTVSMWRFEPEGLQQAAGPLELAPKISAPAAIVVADGFAWIVDRLQPRLVRVALTPGGEVREVPLRHQGTSVAAGHGYIWVTAENDDTLVRVDPLSLQTADFAVGNAPDAVVAGEGGVWVALRGARSVVFVDTEGNADQPIDVTAVPSGLVIQDGRLWVTLQAAN